jgi:deoxyribodipyrimidine photo-lyase
VEFIRESLVQLDEALRSLAGQAAAGLITVHGSAAREIPRWPGAGRAGRVRQPRLRAGAIARDAQVRGALADAGIAFHTARTRRSSIATNC